MARIRTVKPELAAHEGLFDLELETGLPVRFAWCMLFTACDREGRFAWRPRTLKAQILPHDDVDFSRVLDAWLTRGFIVKYRVGDEWFGWLPTFTRHQVVNNRESPSALPGFEVADETQDYRRQAVTDEEPKTNSRVLDACLTREVHAQGEGEGRKGKGKEREGELVGPKSSKRSAPKFDPQTMPIPTELDTPEFNAAWSDWCEARKSKGKPITQPAAKQQFTDFVAWGAAVAAQQIRESIRCDYTGVFPPKNNGSQNGHGADLYAGLRASAAGRNPNDRI